MTRRTISVAVALAFVGLGALVTTVGCRVHRRQAGYDRVDRGSSARAVDELMGPPDSINLHPGDGGINESSCSKGCWWDEVVFECSSLCAKEYRYSSFFTTEKWLVGFDDKGETISKYHYVLP